VVYFVIVLFVCLLLYLIPKSLVSDSVNIEIHDFSINIESIDLFTHLLDKLSLNIFSECEIVDCCASSGEPTSELPNQESALESDSENPDDYAVSHEYYDSASTSDVEGLEMRNEVEQHQSKISQHIKAIEEQIDTKSLSDSDKSKLDNGYKLCDEVDSRGSNTDDTLRELNNSEQELDELKNRLSNEDYINSDELSNSSYKDNNPDNNNHKDNNPYDSGAKSSDTSNKPSNLKRSNDSPTSGDDTSSKRPRLP
jgi:hypothetical protein